jgi:hypothetical protein
VVARTNSSGTVQQRFDGATYTGTAATTLSGTATLSGFVTGDLVAVIVENRRTSGGGARTTTINTTSDSFVQVTPPPLGVAESLSVTATTGDATGEQPPLIPQGVAENLSVSAAIGTVVGRKPSLLPKPPPPPTQGGSIRIEIGFKFNANLQEIAGENPPFTLDDPVLGQLDVAELPGGDVWIDVSNFLIDGLEVVRGRNRAVDLFTAGRANFRLNNRDRTFDPTNTDSPFFGNLTPMRPVRISAQVGTTVERLFQGFVTDWTFRYGRPVDAWVDVDCVDPFIAFASDDLPELETPVGDGDTSDVRVGRVLDSIGFGPQRNLTAGTFPLAETTFGVNALAHMEQAATSDASFFFVARDGVVTLLNALTVYGSTPTLTLVQSNVSDAGLLYHDVELTTASELLYNVVNVTWDGGTVSRTDALSVAEYLPRSLTIQTLLRDETNAELLADFSLVKYANPELRLRNVSVKVHDKRLSAADRVELCRLDVGRTVTVVRRPPGVGTPLQSEFVQVVEGLTWRYARDVWTVTVRLGDVVGPPFTLDDAVLGQLDVGGILVF